MSVQLMPIEGPVAYSDEWYQARKKTIGASEAAACLGMSGFAQPLDVFLSKKSDDGGKNGKMNDAMQRGKDFEPICLMLYGRNLGGTLHTEVPMLIHPDYPFMSATPDALWSGDNIGKLDWSYNLDYIPVEAKTTEMFDGWGSEGTDEIPPCYIIQSQQHMAVTGKERCDVPVLNGFNYKLYHVHRDQEIIDTLVSVESEMIERVANDDPPEINWEHPKTPELVTRMHKVTEKDMALPAEFCEKWLEMETLKSNAREM